ncbi:uncharacterized protein isoform X2 [Musca autumnalis]|uniref:uncharacterized protein isoform X2 n=1 Tax=Musca autumnalis TaxID=221902 RepID=UPI003CF0B487
MVNLSMPFLAPRRSLSCPLRLSCRELQWLKMGYQLGEPSIPKPPDPYQGYGYCEQGSYMEYFQPYTECESLSRDKEHLWPQPRVWCNCRPPLEKRQCDICLEAQKGRNKNFENKARGAVKANSQNLPLESKVRSGAEYEGRDVFQDVDEYENRNTDYDNDENDDAESYCSACEEVDTQKKTQKEILIIYPKDSFYESVERTNKCGSNIIKIHTFVNYEPSSCGGTQTTDSSLREVCPCSSKRRQELDKQSENLISVVSYGAWEKCCQDVGKQSSMNAKNKCYPKISEVSCRELKYNVGPGPSESMQSPTNACWKQKNHIESDSPECLEFHNSPYRPNNCPTESICPDFQQPFCVDRRDLLQQPKPISCHKETQTILHILEPQLKRSCYYCNERQNMDEFLKQNNVDERYRSRHPSVSKFPKNTSNTERYPVGETIWETPFENFEDCGERLKASCGIQKSNKFQEDRRQHNLETEIPHFTKYPKDRFALFPSNSQERFCQCKKSSSNLKGNKSKLTENPRDKIALLSANSLQIPCQVSKTPQTRDFLKLHKSWQVPTCHRDINFQFSIKPQLIATKSSVLAPTSSNIPPEYHNQFEHSEHNLIPKKSSHVSRRSLKFKKPRSQHWQFTCRHIYK